ncbi:MAG: AzlC family ABC transporter permease [Candidatus Alectryocaccobium sp.]|jgi:predicted branched-subunit amino acid permease|nr:AzlC family ABC transporter permease [Lachnospiraceae bacterium]MDY6220831.1 AzlC family ABC transporter permease [Candidatus Alectryocaccobium sp.]
MRYSQDNKKVFLLGMQDGLPIGFGYLAVSFSLGIAARKVGLTPLQGFLASFLTNASAGEYAAWTVIGEAAPYIEMFFAILIANARYFLMACALSQRFSPDTKLRHRLLVGFDLTDEIFGITIARPGYLNPFYSYGAMTVALPSWAIGTALGIVIGNILPVRAVSALSVSLYAMFLAIIMPPAKKDKVIAVLIAICFAASYAFARLPMFAFMSSGTRTIILTVVIAGVASVLFPVKEEKKDE